MISTPVLLVMLKHAFIFVGCTFTALPVFFNALKIPPTPELRDISSFIENFLQNEPKYNNGRDDRSQEVGKGKSYIAISSRELDELINQVANDVYNRGKNKNNDRVTNLKGLKNYEIEFIQDKPQQHLSFTYLHRKPQHPRTGVSSSCVSSDSSQSESDEYFRTDVIHNQQANIKNREIKDITDLLLRVLSGPNSKKTYSEQGNSPIKQERRYKGFIIADGPGARRRNRVSKELYSPQDSLEEYKPKRVRNEYRGLGGRTPIPYIRHRDIYERD